MQTSPVDLTKPRHSIEMPIKSVLTDSVTDILKYRKMILSTTISDIKSKYAGSLLGYLWLALYPVLFLGMYAVIYIFIFKVRLQVLSPYEYVLLIFAGLIPFLSISEALGRGVNAVTANANLLKNTLFPIELIPVNITLSSQLIQVIGFILLILILAFMGRLGPAAALLIPVWILQIVYSIGVVWIISALNVFFKDVSNIISILILMLMMVSPIAYTEDLIPPELRVFLYINPLYYLIMLYQKALIFGTFDPRLFGIFAAIAVSHYLFGFFIFKKLKGVFSDYV